MRRTSAAIAIIVLLASACSSGIGKPGDTTPGASLPPAATHPAPATASVPSAAPATIPLATEPPGKPLDGVGHTFLVVAEKGSDGLQVIAAGTGEQFMTIPEGMPVAGWTRVLTATPANGETALGVFRFEDIDNPPSLTIDGTWRLPTIGEDPTPVGLSGDTTTQVLVDASAGAATASTSRFAVVPASLKGKPKVISLDGHFDYDAISTDGRTLYVVEHLAGPPAGHYQVRQLDVATGALQSGVIADKRNLDEAMGGYPLGQLRLNGGLIATLYAGAEHPFIHALHTLEGFAFCIDLPSTGDGSATSASDWGIAATAGGPEYAVNASAGLVVQVDASAGNVLRSAQLKPLAATGIALAKFNDGVGGQVGRRAIVAPDGTVLYAAGAGGVLSISVSDLKATGRWLEGQAVDGLALTKDGSTLFALLHGSGRIAAIDTAGGKLLGMVPGAGYTWLAGALPGE
jgi:hypothetical protein